VYLYKCVSMEVKRQWREADHSPPISTEVKKTWIYTSIPPYAFMAYDPGVDSAANRNEYQEFSWGLKGGRRVGLTNLPPSVSRLCRQNVGASTSHNTMNLHGLLRHVVHIVTALNE
jgi:hypothetical protein